MTQALTLLLTLSAMLFAADVAPAADNESYALLNETAHEQQRDPSREALRRLFDKYGGRDSGRMTFEGFEHLLESLGLGHIVIDDHDVHDHQTDDGRFRALHDHHAHHDDDAAAESRQAVNGHEEHAESGGEHAADTHDHQRRRSAGADTVQQSAAVNDIEISEVRMVFVRWLQVSNYHSELCST